MFNHALNYQNDVHRQILHGKFLVLIACGLMFVFTAADVSKPDASVDNGDEGLSVQATVLSFSNITGDGLGDTGEGPHSTVFADVNADSHPDLYITMAFNGLQPDLFFRNMGDGMFSEEAVSRGISNEDGGSHGACFVDLDNDGDFDLLNGSTVNHNVSGAGFNTIYENDGIGFFRDQTPSCMMNHQEYTRAILAFDMDRDGDLDIFSVSGYLGTDDPPEEVNELYINQGGLVFDAVSNNTLLTAPAGQGATDTDFDDDGDIDIIAANRTGALNIARNDGFGQFNMVPFASICDTEHSAGDGITMGDTDNDGDLDMLLVSEGPPSEAVLYQNVGMGYFVKDTMWTDVEGYMGGFADLDNDGDVDLLFAGDSRCWLNDGNGSFEPGPVIPYNDTVDPRSIAFSDIDSDGDVDFCVADKRLRSHLVRNDLSGGGRWFKVRLVSPYGQAGAMGAKVYVYASGTTQLLGFREARSNNGYLGQDDPDLHFGMGSHLDVDVCVAFSDGSRVKHSGIRTNQTFTPSVESVQTTLSVRIFLEGACGSGLHEMDDSLSLQGFLPLTAPYVEDARTVQVLPQGAVDWVLLELRQEPDAEAAFTRSAIVRKNGKITDDDGQGDWLTLDVPAGDYYVVVRHRNHLPVMSADPVVLSAGHHASYDFTQGQDRYYEGSGAKAIAADIWGMAAGDVDLDGSLFASDLAVIRQAMDTDVAGYLDVDADMNGTISVSDYHLCKGNVLSGLYSTVHVR